MVTGETARPVGSVPEAATPRSYRGSVPTPRSPSDGHRELPGRRGAAPVVAQTVREVAVVEGLGAVLALIVICWVVLGLAAVSTTWASRPPQSNGRAGKPARPHVTIDPVY